MDFAIIGCGGFISSHALDRLLCDESVHITGWDPHTRKIEHHLDNPRLRLHQHAINEPEREDDLRDTVRWVDTIINLAAICNPSEYNTNPSMSSGQTSSTSIPLWSCAPRSASN